MAIALGAVGLYILRLTPSRYIATYLPEPVQAWLAPPRIELPTPIATLPAQQWAALLTPIPSPTPTSTATPQMTLPPATTTPLVMLPTVTATPTPTLTLTPAYAPGPTQIARSTPAVLADTTILLTGLRHVYQAWNNCGPASLTMNLSYFGWPGTQADAAAFLKPDPEDRNVAPEEIVAFARAQGYQAIVRYGGTLDTLKALLHAGLPVLIEKGFEPEEKLGWMGHYLLLVGYDPSRQEFVAMDSYLGPMQAAPFAETDHYWRQFNRMYIVIYRPDNDQTLLVSQLLGGASNDAMMWQNTMATAQSEVALNSNDAFGWFNLGSSYEAMGLHVQATLAYDRARHIGLPWRMTWYQFGWFEAYLAAGRYADVLALAEATLKSNPYSEEMYYYTGRVYAAQGDSQAARTQYHLALEHNPNFAAAQQALAALGP